MAFKGFTEEEMEYRIMYTMPKAFLTSERFKDISPMSKIVYMVIENEVRRDDEYKELCGQNPEWREANPRWNDPLEPGDMLGALFITVEVMRECEAELLKCELISTDGYDIKILPLPY